MSPTKQKPDTARPLEPVRDGSRPEIVEVEVERLGVKPTRREVVRERVVSLFKPILLGAMVDLGDVITPPMFAPIVLPVGLFVGYLFARVLDAPPTWRLLIAGLVGVYWIVPFTSPIPVAAATAAIVYIFRPDVMERDPILGP